MNAEKEIDLAQVFLSIVRTLIKQRVIIILIPILSLCFGLFQIFTAKKGFESITLFRNNLNDINLLTKSTNIFVKNINKVDLKTLLKIDDETLNSINTLKLESINSPNFLLKISGTNVESISKTKTAIRNYYKLSLKNEIDFEIRNTRNLVIQINKNLSEQDTLYQKAKSSLNTRDRIIIMQGSIINKEYFELFERGLFYERVIARLEKDGAMSEINSIMSTIENDGNKTGLLFSYFIVTLLLTCIAVILVKYLSVISKKV